MIHSFCLTWTSVPTLEKFNMEEISNDEKSNKNTKFGCQFCLQNFQTKKGWIRHEKLCKVSSENPEKFVCGLCLKGFFSKQLRKRHEKVCKAWKARENLKRWWNDGETIQAVCYCGLRLVSMKFVPWNSRCNYESNHESKH